MQPNEFLSIFITGAVLCLVAVLLRAVRKQARNRHIRRIESRLVNW
jgi:hypothetical protein